MGRLLRRKWFWLILLLACTGFRASDRWLIGDDYLPAVYRQKNTAPTPTATATPFVPTQTSPVAIYAPQRISAAEAFILRIRRVVEADEVDCYDIQTGTFNYKLTAGGAWVSALGNTIYVTIAYDQAGTNNMVQATAGNQFQLRFNVRNGYAALYCPNTALFMQNTAPIISVSTGAVVASISTSTTANSTFYTNIRGVWKTSTYSAGVSVGRKSSGGVGIHWYNFDTGYDAKSQLNYNDTLWRLTTWQHYSNTLTAWSGTTDLGDADSGDTDDVGTLLYWADDANSFTGWGYYSVMFVYDRGLTDTEKTNLATWFNTH